MSVRFTVRRPMGDFWVTYGRPMGDLWATYGLDTAKVGETREVCRQIKRRMFFAHIKNVLYLCA